MPDLKSELAKVGKYAGPSMSCDARPAPKKERPRDSRLVEIYYLKQYTDRVGYVKAADALGITASGISTMMSRGSCSPVYEKFSHLLLMNDTDAQLEPQHEHFVVTVPVDDGEVFRRVIAGLGCTYAKLEV